MLLSQQLEENLYEVTDPHIRRKLVGISDNDKKFTDMARNFGRDIYRQNMSMNNEIGKFDDDPCYV